MSDFRLVVQHYSRGLVKDPQYMTSLYDLGKEHLHKLRLMRQVKCDSVGETVRKLDALGQRKAEAKTSEEALDLAAQQKAAKTKLKEYKKELELVQVEIFRLKFDLRLMRSYPNIREALKSAKK